MAGEPAHLTDEVSREYAERLLVANDPDEVAAIVGEIESTHDVVWKPLGDDENNYSDVYTQAAAPMPAFAEIPLNSADSQMLRFYSRSAADSVEPDEYTSMKEAVDADWVDLDDAEIEIIADGLMPADGNLLNLTVRDNGKGKGRDEFVDFVGLHSPGLKKQDYGFLQGQYGMGSTAPMQFAGNIEEEYNERAFKFIASASSDAPGEWSWTLVHDKPHRGQVDYLTVDGEFPVFDGTFGGALADKFRENYPDQYDLDANADVPEPQNHGAFVKIYDYQTKASRALISGSEGFRRKFERSIVDSPFPIRLTDMRYESKIPQSSTEGFLQQLDGREHLLVDDEHITLETNSETLGERDAHVLLFKSDDELEDVETTSRGKSDFVASTTGHKGSSSRTGIQRDHAVMFTINGQTHGSKGEYFLRSLGYSKVAEDTVVIVEFDDLANLGMVNMFSASRDSLKESPQADRFLNALEEALENSDLLSDEEDRRRAKRGSDEAEVDTETFSDFIERNPEFANFIASGDRIDAPRIRPSDAPDVDVPENEPDDDPSASDRVTKGKGEEESGEEQFETPLLPTYLRPIKEYDPAGGDHEYWDESDGIMPVEMPTDRGTTIRFETDAQSNYLVREVLSGSLNVSPSARFGSVELQDGLLTLTIRPEEEVDVGNDFGLTVELTRPDPEECDLIDDPADAFPDPADGDEEISTDGGAVDTRPLTSMFTVEYVEAENEEPTNTPSTDEQEQDPDAEGDDGEPDDQESNEGDSGDDSGEWAFDMPEINIVYEENWRVDDDGDPMDEERYDPGVAGEFDEHTLIRIDESRDGTISGLTLTINMDPALLRVFIVERNVRERWKEFVENQYRLAVVFYAISGYRELSGAYGEALGESGIMITDIVERTINGLGPALMPTIIPEEHLDRITE